MILLAAIALANPDGKSGVAVSGCTCHGEASPRTDVTLSASATEVDPGAVVSFVVLVENSGKSVAGIDFAASDGEFTAGENTKVYRYEVVQPEAIPMTDGLASFGFEWTAPDEPGTYRIYGAGNACNDDGESSGDAWAFAQDVDMVVGGGGDADTDADSDSDSDSDSDTDSDSDSGTGTPPPECGCGVGGAPGGGLALLVGFIAGRRGRVARG